MAAHVRDHRISANASRTLPKLPSQTKNSAWLIPAVFLLSSCGVLDAYKDKEKRCKLNCKSDDSSGNANDEPFNFDLNFWNQSTPRSKLDPTTEVAAILRSNPFKLIANALKTVSDDINDAKQTASATPTSPQGQCLKERFSTALAKNNERTSATLDYGKCVDLIKLQERLNANRNTDRDGKMKVLEIGSALQLQSSGSLQLVSGGDALQDAGNGFELPNVFPFKTIRSSDLLDPNAVKNFSLHLMRGSVQGVALERTSAATVLKKSWGVLYAGLNDLEPLRFEWSPSIGQLKMTGSVATLSASFQRPTTQTQWDSFGYSREFIFADFTVSNTGLELSPQLGWTEQANLSGSYFLRINGDLVGTGGSGSQLFRMQALGRPCQLNVGLVTGFQGDVPVEQSLGQISICSTAQ